jgi:hypothetical protein
MDLFPNNPTTGNAPCKADLQNNDVVRIARNDGHAVCASEFEKKN